LDSRSVTFDKTAQAVDRERDGRDDNLEIALISLTTIVKSFDMAGGRLATID